MATFEIDPVERVYICERCGVTTSFDRKQPNLERVGGLNVCHECATELRR